MSITAIYYFVLLKSTTEKTPIWSTAGLAGVQIPHEMHGTQQDLNLCKAGTCLCVLQTINRFNYEVKAKHLNIQLNQCPKEYANISIHCGTVNEDWFYYEIF